MQSMAVTEPTTGTDTTRLKTTAVRKGDRWVVNGQKVWISRVRHSDLMVLLARTTPLAEVKRKADGLSVFLVDLRAALGKGLSLRPIANMVNHETNELFFDDLELPADSLIGEEGKGFRYILDGLNAERVLIAAECIGDARWFVARAAKYAGERRVFDRPIGQNQGVQFPIAESHIETEAASLMRFRACELYDTGRPCGAEANMAKYLAAKASWEAANACIQTHGGFGFAADYDIERKFRETRLYQVAPISTSWKRSPSRSSARPSPNARGRCCSTPSARTAARCCTSCARRSSRRRRRSRCCTSTRSGSSATCTRCATAPRVRRAWTSWCT